MATILPNAVNQFIDANGNPLESGLVYMYVPGTTTPKDTWQDSDGTILNTNPIVLNSSGEAIIYGSGAYRQVVYAANGDLVWDQLTADTSVGGFAWGGVTTGTANAQVGDASSFSSQDGQQYGFIAGFSNSGPMTVNPGGSGAIPVLRDSPTGPVPCVGGEVVADNECTLVYEAARGAFHLTNPAIGTLATQNADAVAITGGTIAGVTMATSTINTSTINQPTLTLKQSASPTPTAEGDVQWDTDDNLLVVGNGASQTVFRPVMPGMLWGLTTSNNVSDATNDIDIATGYAADSTNTLFLTLAAGLTKRLDATWAAGTNQGGRFSAVSLTNTTYHVFLIYNPTTGVTDVGFDTSLTAANHPSGYTVYRRIASIVRTGGSIKAYIQVGDFFTWMSPSQDLALNAPGTAAVTVTTTIPTGLQLNVRGTAFVEVSTGSSTFGGYVSSLLTTDLAASNAALTFSYDGDVNGGMPGYFDVISNTSAQVRYRVSNGSGAYTAYLLTLGWTDTRGRLA